MKNLKNPILLKPFDQMDPICNGSFLMVSNENALEAYMLMGVPKVMMMVMRMMMMTMMMMRRLTC